MHSPDTWNHEKHKRSRSDHPCDITGLEELVSTIWRKFGGAWKAHIVEDVKIGIARVSSGHDGAIVGNLDGIVECIQVDAFNNETGHLGGL
jgi:hypothetical protein